MDILHSVLHGVDFFLGAFSKTAIVEIVPG